MADRLSFILAGRSYCWMLIFEKTAFSDQNLTTYIILWKSGQTQTDQYVEEDNVSDTAIEAFTSVIFTASLKDNAQASAWMTALRPLIPCHKTYSEVLRLLSEWYLKSSSLIDDDLHCSIKRWRPDSYANNGLRASDVLL